MPTLDWAGKQAVVEYHKRVPAHVLRSIPALSVGEAGTGNLRVQAGNLLVQAGNLLVQAGNLLVQAGNLLVQGDNLLALKALLPAYAGRVKYFYIDPPYNTGNEKWVYNDNVNSPEIEQWLGHVLGGEIDDLSRHDRWLCMIYPRLVLLRELLSAASSLWMSIDDHEMHRARTVLDEVFGEDQFVAVITSTGHAVLQLNRKEGGQRRFILVEMVPAIARENYGPAPTTGHRGLRVDRSVGQAPSRKGAGRRLCLLRGGATLVQPARS